MKRNSKKIKNENMLLVFGVILLILCFIFDKYIFAAVQSLKNPFFDIIFNWATAFPTVFAIMLFVTSLFMYENRKRKWILPLWLSFFAANILSYLLKFILRIPRPEGIQMIIPILHLIDYSFPSSHAASAFSTVPILDREYKALKWFWVLFALTVAVSRVYAGVHLPSDVVGGALLGYFVGVIFVRMNERIPKKNRR